MRNVRVEQVVVVVVVAQSLNPHSITVGRLSVNPPDQYVDVTDQYRRKTHQTPHMPH